MAGPTYISSTTAAPGGVTSLVLNVPASLTNGNQLLAFIYGETPGSTTITPPGGWTLVDSAPGTNSICSCYTRTVASEPPSYTWTFSPMPNPSACMVQYTACTVDGHSNNHAVGSAWSTTAFTAGHANDTVVIGVGVDNASSTTAPAGTTNHVSFFQSPLVGMLEYDATAASTSVASYSATWNAGSNWNAVAVALLSSTVTVSGTATLALGPLTLTSTGTISGGTVTGTAILALGPLTLTSTGISTTGSRIALGPLTLTTLSIVAALPTPATVTLTDTSLTTTTLPADIPLTTVTLQDIQ